MIPFAFLGANILKNLIAGIRSYGGSLILIGDTGIGLNGSTISSWQDQSPNKFSVTQTATNQQPSYLTGDSSGKNGVRLGTSATGLISNYNITLQSAGYSIIMVERPYTDSAGLTRTVQSIEANALMSLTRRNGDQFYLRGDVAITASLYGSVGSFGVASLSCAGSGSAEAHLNNTSITNVNTPVASWGSIAIGASGMYAEPGQTDLFAVVVVPYASRVAVTTLLANYYKVTLSS